MVKTNQIILGVSILCYLIGVILIMKYDPFNDNPVAKAMSISLLVFGFLQEYFTLYFHGLESRCALLLVLMVGCKEFC